MKHTARNVILTAVVTSVAACASIPEMTREQYLAATSRLYPGASKEQVIAACEQVLRLIDRNKTQIAHTDEGLSATRMSTGWELRVRETADGPRAFVQIRSSSTVPFFVGGVAPGGLAAVPYNTPSGIVPGDAAYFLFWQRVDYMLWRRDTWATCGDADELISQKKIFGPLDPLCTLVVPDDAPGQPLKAYIRNTAAEAASPATTLIPVAPDRKR